MVKETYFSLFDNVIRITSRKASTFQKIHYICPPRKKKAKGVKNLIFNTQKTEQ